MTYFEALNLGKDRSCRIDLGMRATQEPSHCLTISDRAKNEMSIDALCNE